MKQKYALKLKEILEMQCPTHFKIIQTKKLESELREFNAAQKKQRQSHVQKKENCQSKQNREEVRQLKQQIAEMQANIIELKREKMRLSDCVEEAENQLEIFVDISLVRKTQNKLLDSKIGVRMQRVQKKTRKGMSKSFFSGGSIFEKLQEYSKPFFPQAK